MNPRSSSTLAWFSAILILVGLIAPNPALRFFLFVTAAVCAALPALLGRERSRIAALIAVVASAALAAGAYLEFRAHMKTYRQHAEKQQLGRPVQPAETSR